MTDINSKGTFWLPPNASPLTGGQDALFYFVYYLSVFFFIVVVGFMVFFAVKYRKKKQNEKTADIHGHTWLEIIWSAIPAVLFVIIFAWGFWGWIKLNVVPQNALEVRVTAKKWDWSFTDVSSGAETSDLIVPVNTPIKLIMSSTDVIHGFYVPDFRINRDVLPSQYTISWFQAPKEGSHAILCTQYCGTKHSQMVRYVKVVSQEQYKKEMIAAQGAGLTPAELGKKIFLGKGACASCHDITSEKKKLVGPPLFALYGSKGKITDDSGERVVEADDAYIRESILNPNAKIVEGYTKGVMPPYQGQLNDKEIIGLIEFIKTLK